MLVFSADSFFLGGEVVSKQSNQNRYRMKKTNEGQTDGSRTTSRRAPALLLKSKAAQVSRDLTPDQIKLHAVFLFAGLFIIVAIVMRIVGVIGNWEIKSIIGVSF